MEKQNHPIQFISLTNVNKHIPGATKAYGRARPSLVWSCLSVGYVTVSLYDSPTLHPQPCVCPPLSTSRGTAESGQWRRSQRQTGDHKQHWLAEGVMNRRADGSRTVQGPGRRKHHARACGGKASSDRRKDRVIIKKEKTK